MKELTPEAMAHRGIGCAIAGFSIGFIVAWYFYRLVRCVW